MVTIHGPILTNCHSLTDVAACIRNGGYTALKVVTGWGSPTGWNRLEMTEVARMVPYLVVRTVAGDPSYDGGSHRWPVANQIVQEIAPWYTVRSDILIEIGNEPNRAGWSESDCWGYRWHLDQAITACRAAFPRAKIIAPALLIQPNTNAQRWLAIGADVMRTCDYIGVHVYEHDAWLRSEQRHGTTEQTAMAWSLYTQYFSDRPWLLTEYGINDPGTLAAIKGQRYAAFVRHGVCTPKLPASIVGALYYHYCADGKIDPQYHIAPTGDVAYKRIWEDR